MNSKPKILTVTNQTRNTDQLRQSNGPEQENGNGEIAEAELIRARKIAEGAAHARLQFLSVMSHEIRTPLNAIINTTHLLMDSTPGDDQTQHLGVLQFSAESLLQLVNRILEYSKIDAGRIELEEGDFEIRELIDLVHQSLEPEAYRRGIFIEAVTGQKVPAVLTGDRARITQILMNLVGNAIKYTDFGKVSLSVDLLKNHRDSVEVIFKVTDTGIGIPADQLENIFENYTQIDPSGTRKNDGAGLGLAITRMLVELHGGRLRVESKPGQGSTFSFSLKLGKTGKEHMPESIAFYKKFRSLKGMDILVAEDNIINQKIMNTILGKWDVTSDIAENGKIALEKIRNHHYNLVLMDLHMPEMNGYDATRAIRNMKGEYYRNVPIIALTATAFTEERAKFASFGLNGYIIKPFTPPELYSTISHFIK
ncbi:MAG: ATP-binding protein [Bacteroidetes bacterium]|nr:ATP-binding protein [Bacteroidota bacterium]